MSTANPTSPGPIEARDANEVRLQDAVGQSNARRSVCFGEALRALSACKDLDIASPPDTALIELLDCAYDQIISERTSVSPEDYTVYVFSLLLLCGRSDDEMLGVRASAQRYMANVAARLSPDIAALAAEVSPVHLARDDSAITEPELLTFHRLATEQDRSISVSDIRARRRRLEQNSASPTMRNAIWILVFVLLLMSLTYLGLGGLLHWID